MWHQAWQNRCITSFTEVVAIDWMANGTLFLNRESSGSQCANHGAKIRELRKAHHELGIPTSFKAEIFTGSNSLRFLNDPKNKFYPELRRAIQDELSKTPGTLYVFFVCLDRLMRPYLFDKCRYSETCTLTDTDYQMFWEWMEFHFGDLAKDIVFVVLNDSSELDGSYATRSGMHYKGNFGGRPKKHKSRINQRTSARLQELTIHLAKTTAMDATDIWRHLVNGGESVSYSAVQRWLQKKGLSRKRGKRTRKTFIEN